jgi:hypothetical protein
VLDAGLGGQPARGDQRGVQPADARRPVVRPADRLVGARAAQARPNDDVRAYLNIVLVALDELAGDANAALREEAEIEARSAQLESEAEKKLRNASGVYIYTYPHYWRHPYVPGTERRLVKVGKTDGAAFTRIRAQARQSGAPEEPLLLRVYVAPEPGVSERSFHRLLDAAEHSRNEGATAGREWFSTTLEFCDEIAAALRLEVLAADVT